MRAGQSPIDGGCPAVRFGSRAMEAQLPASIAGHLAHLAFNLPIVASAGASAPAVLSGRAVG